MKHNSTLSAGHGRQRDRSREKFWRETMRHFAGSGQSVRVFCGERGLSEPSFYVWRRALAERDAVLSQSPGPATPTPAFVPVRLADAAGGRMEVILGGGRRIRLRGPVDRAMLAEVLAALADPSSTPSPVK